MTWLSTLFLRSFVVFIQIGLICSEDNGPLPGFKQHPIDTLIESSNQTIVCDIYGKDPLFISWLKEGKNLDTTKLHYLSISKEGSLNIVNTQRARDEGEYRCVVENTYGRVFSRKAAVTFPYMNDFSVEATSVEVTAGDQALLECRSPDSYPDKNIYWSSYKIGRFENIVNIDTQSHFATSISGDLYFSYTKESDSGVYYCRVENEKLRRFESRTVKLKVSPKITQQNISPKVWSFPDHIAMKDSNFVLECISVGRPVPIMTFRNVRTGTELTGSQQVGNRLRYEFGKFMAEYEGEYSCEVANAYGEKSSNIAYIKMEAKPEMLQQSKEIQVAVDSLLEMPCIATEVSKATYNWFFNGNPLSGGKGITMHHSNVTISKVMKHHQGFYQCLAHNRHGEDLLTLHVTVVEIPANFGAMSIPPAPSTQALVGGSAEINCVPSGAPKPTIRWQKVGSNIDIVTEDERFAVLPTGTLKIINLKRSDAGRYECVAANKLKTARKIGELIVNSGLVITEPLTTKETIQIGSKIILRCSYDSYEKTEILFKWYIGLRKLRKSQRVKITRLSKKQSQLEIDNAQSRDTGNYACKVVATNSRKAEKRQMIFVVAPTDGGKFITQRPSKSKTTTTSSTRFIIRGPPDPPQDVSATEMSGLNIKISWTMGRDNGAPATRVHIQARTTFDLDVWHDIKVSNKTKRVRESEIVNLSPWVQYKIRVISESKYGKSEPSIETDKWVRTPTAKPSLYPTNILGLGTGPNQLTISFDLLEEIDQNAPGISYIVFYRAEGSTYEPVSRVVPKNQNFIKLNFLNTDSNSYYKPYEFQVQAKNDDGDGPRSPMHVAFTGARVPLIAPTNLRVKLDGKNNAIAQWDDVTKERSSIRGKFLGYKFLYWVAPEETNKVEVENYVSSVTNTASVKLKAFTKYYFQVLTYNKAGDGPRSEKYGPLQTPEGVPSKPANFIVEDASLNYVTLTWDEPLHPNGIIKEYTLTYDSIPSKQPYVKTLAAEVRKIQLNNLVPDETYIFKLVASTNAGVSIVSEISFDISKVPKMKLAAPIVKSRGHSAMVLTWLSAPSRTHISGYKLFYWETGGSEIKAMALWERSNDIVTTVHSLNPGTTYFFQIAVVNRYGTGPRSEITSAVTMEITTNRPIVDSSSRQMSFSCHVIALCLFIAVFVPR